MANCCKLLIRWLSKAFFSFNVDKIKKRGRWIKFSSNNGLHFMFLGLYFSLRHQKSEKYLKKWPIIAVKWTSRTPTAQKMKFSIKDFFSKCDQICSFLRIRSHLQRKFLLENFIFLPCSFRDLVIGQET